MAEVCGVGVCQREDEEHCEECGSLHAHLDVFWYVRHCPGIGERDEHDKHGLCCEEHGLFQGDSVFDDGHRVQMRSWYVCVQY
eukprot:3307216-Pleurochrysis_carterae.AAC.1